MKKKKTGLFFDVHELSRKDDPIIDYNSKIVVNISAGNTTAHISGTRHDKEDYGSLAFGFTDSTGKSSLHLMTAGDEVFFMLDGGNTLITPYQVKAALEALKSYEDKAGIVIERLA